MAAVTAGAGTADPRVSADPRRPLEVLVIEDAEDHAELIRRSFESRPDRMSLTLAPNLHEARAYLDRGAPDLALIDLVLPDGKGTELLPGAEETALYPIVIMTGQGDEEAAVEAMKAGALNYVVKTAETLSTMPQIVQGALREWGHVMERRRAEAALHASEEHFRSLIENGLDVITEIDERGDVYYASPSVERALGYLPEDWISANLFSLIHPDDRPEAIAKVFEAFDEPGSVHSFESRYRHKIDGTVRTLEAVACAHVRGDGEKRAVVNSRDVTERKQAEEERQKLEEQLRHSQKWELIGTLAGGIANEFNNMLTPILGFASMSLEETPPHSKIRQRLERILTAANRMQELAEQILAFSRQSEPQRQQVDLHRVVDEAIRLLRPTLPSNIEIRQHVDGVRGQVIADPDQMHQVLMNLCTNAHHAMPEGGVLEVALDEVEIDAEFVARHSRPRAGAYLRLTVSDTGHGMDPEIRERVLEPFFTTRGDAERTGLGLSVTHSIVVSHGGDLMLESEPGKGTKVHVYLPRQDEPLEQGVSCRSS